MMFVHNQDHNQHHNRLNKKQRQFYSVQKIRISHRGLPSDFFNHSILYVPLRGNERCKTVAPSFNQFSQSYLANQHRTIPISLPREGRQYKSQQRKRPSKQAFCGKQLNKQPKATWMDCTFSSPFFRKGVQQLAGARIKSDRIGHKQAIIQQARVEQKRLQKSKLYMNERVMNNEATFQKLRDNLRKMPLPLIRLTKKGQSS